MTSPSNPTPTCAVDVKVRKLNAGTRHRRAIACSSPRPRRVQARTSSPTSGLAPHSKADLATPDFKSASTGLHYIFGYQLAGDHLFGHWRYLAGRAVVMQGILHGGRGPRTSEAGPLPCAVQCAPCAALETRPAGPVRASDAALRAGVSDQALLASTSSRPRRPSRSMPCCPSSNLTALSSTGAGRSPSTSPAPGRSTPGRQRANNGAARESHLQPARRGLYPTRLERSAGSANADRIGQCTEGRALGPALPGRWASR